MSSAVPYKQNVKIMDPAPTGVAGVMIQDDLKAIADKLELLDAVGVSGRSGFSGTSGATGATGSAGATGSSGVSGFSGTSGVSGFSGTSGVSGFSGTSGVSGFSGTSGVSGFSGTSGVSGFSGTSGRSGFSGTSGVSGYSGTSGISGFSGSSGVSGFSGTSGVSGYSGTSGTSGFSGTPAGSDTYVQFNDGGAFGGDAGLTYNKTTSVLTANKAVLGSIGPDTLSLSAGTQTGILASTQSTPLKISTQNATALFASSGSIDIATGTSSTGTLGSVKLKAGATTRIEAGHVGIGFFAVNPVTRQPATTDIKDALTSYGLLQGTSASPLDLDGGALTAGGITATDITISSAKTISLTRTLPTVVGNAVDIGSFALTNGTGNFELWITVPSSGYSQCKRYFITAQYGGTSGTWRTVMPISTTGPYSAEDANLEININNGTTSFRLRKAIGTTAGTAYVLMIHQGIVGDVFTPSSTSGSATAPTQSYFNAAEAVAIGGFTTDAGSYNLQNWNSTGNTVPITVRSPTKNGGSTPATAEPAMVLCRSGVGSQSYANFAEFKLSRYANTGTKANTALTIALTGGDSQAAGTDVFELRADGQTTLQGTLTGSSGNANSLVVTPTINQSGTAGYTAINVNVTETATGSGTKRLIDAQVGGVSKFSVSSTGIVNAAGLFATSLEGDSIYSFGDIYSETNITCDGTLSAGVVSAGQRILSGVSALTDGATISTNAIIGNTFTVTLGGNRTMAAPTNALNGQRITYRIRQDATGTRTITWNAAFRFVGGVAPTLTTTAAKTDYVEFIYNSADAVWDCVNVSLNH